MLSPPERLFLRDYWAGFVTGSGWDRLHRVFDLARPGQFGPPCPWHVAGWLEKLSAEA